jgi:hypothetical protein
MPAPAIVTAGAGECGTRGQLGTTSIPVDEYEEG